MKLDDIMKLKEAGYTAEEIVNLNNVLEKEQAEQQEKQEKPEQPNFTEMFASMKNEIMAEMKNLFISGDNGSGSGSPESVDDILKNAFGLNKKE